MDLETLDRLSSKAVLFDFSEDGEPCISRMPLAESIKRLRSTPKQFVNELQGHWDHAAGESWTGVSRRNAWGTEYVKPPERVWGDYNFEAQMKNNWTTFGPVWDGDDKDAVSFYDQLCEDEHKDDVPLLLVFCDYLQERYEPQSKKIENARAGVARHMSWDPPQAQAAVQSGLTCLNCTHASRMWQRHYEKMRQQVLDSARLHPGMFAIDSVSEQELQQDVSVGDPVKVVDMDYS